MGLFDKKYCDICGQKIGLLGNRKLEDGNLCKECAAKLSPWFDERRHSTVSQIADQLNYRERNRERVQAFNTTCSYGRNYKVLIDEDAGCFMVTSARNIREANPDVIDFSQITGCDFDVDEDRDEEKKEVKNADGKIERVSYNPPRYVYSYDFYITINVNSPYFDEIRIRLNPSSVEIKEYEERVNRTGNGADVLTSVLQGIAGALNQAGSRTETDFRMKNQDYVEYLNMGQEIKNTLMNLRNRARTTGMQ